jgi:hypothetical protein
MNLKNNVLRRLIQTKVIKDCYNQTLFKKFTARKTTSDF